MHANDSGSTQASSPDKEKTNKLSALIRLTGAVIAAAFLTFLISSGFFGGPVRKAGRVMLMDISGVVEVADEASIMSWRAAANGTYIKKDQRLRTGADGSVVLLFYEGSRTTLGSNTEISLATLDGNGRGALTMEMSQLRGETSHSVVPFQGQESSFKVNTSAGAASVQGTSFRVSVQDDGGTRFLVDEGHVLVTGKNQELVLTAGQVAKLQADKSLDETGYQFTLKGDLTDMNGDVWKVNGVSFQVDQDTKLKGNPKVGDFVLVDGHIDAAGVWVADMVKSMGEKKSKSSFRGVIDQMGASSWVISGIEVLVDENTEKDHGLAIDDPVEVKFIVLDDGRWLALEIESLDEKEDPTATPTETASVTITPSATLTPSVTLTPTATITPTVGVTDCVGADPQPKALKLADTYGVGYDEIMGWFCSGFGFGEIDLAYRLSLESGVPVADIFAMRDAGMGWGQIKADLKPKKMPKEKTKGKPQKTPKPTKTPKK